MNLIKYSLCVTPLLCAAALGGCSADNAEAQTAPLTDFTSAFTAEYRGLRLGGKISNNRQGVTWIEINSPETLGGLYIEYKNSDLKIGRGSIYCTADEAYLLGTGFCSRVRSVMKGLRDGREELCSQTEGTKTFSLRTGAESFTVTADSHGNLKTVEGKDMSIRFE